MGLARSTYYDAAAVLAGAEELAGRILAICNEFERRPYEQKTGFTDAARNAVNDCRSASRTPPKSASGHWRHAIRDVVGRRR